MCKQLCEQSAEGRALWERWRASGDNWQAVAAFHHDAVLAALREEAKARQAAGGTGQVIAFYCAREYPKEAKDEQG